MMSFTLFSIETIIFVILIFALAWLVRDTVKSAEPKSMPAFGGPTASFLYLAIGTLVWLFGAFLVAFPNNFLTVPWPPVELEKIATKFFEEGDKHRTFIPLLITIDVIVGFFIERPNGHEREEQSRHSRLFLLVVSVFILLYLLVAVVAAANMSTIHSEHAVSGFVIAFTALFCLRAMTLYQPQGGRTFKEYGQQSQPS